MRKAGYLSGLIALTLALLSGCGTAGAIAAPGSVQADTAATDTGAVQTAVTTAAPAPDAEMMPVGSNAADASAETEAADAAENGNIYGEEGDEGAESPAATAAPVPPALTEIPEGYTEEAQQQGTLFELYYMTYESLSFEEKSTVLYKRAIVYLPYGYGTEQKYDVLYWMHGGSHDETYLFGDPEEPSEFKNVVDHMIENGELEPLIIVCPTYRNVDYSDTEAPDRFEETLVFTENYHNELVNDLIPLVDETFSTYAEGTTPEELIAARDHRMFAGYSNGSVATWYVLAYCPEYFSRYLAMSCGIGLDDIAIARGVRELAPLPFYLWVISGSEDFALDDDGARIRKLWNSPFFAPPQEIGGNLAFTIGEGYKHGNEASGVYTYNGLKFFFGPDSPWQQQERQEQP